ncbi:MAG: arylsulfatase [Balneolaceae bacterium]|nr:arylsulfatase [Balneolaceae bacterium]
MYPKQIFLFVLFCCLLLVCSCNRENDNKDDLPNIVLILADDLGWSDIGAYGSEISTPNLDSLASNGMQFTHFRNTSKCFPSRGALLTGVYAQQSGYHIDYQQPLKNSVTLGEALRTAGYRTLMSGKHHGLENPYNRGFDRYYGLKEGASNHFNPGKQRPGEPKPANKGRVRPFGIDSVLIAPYTPDKDFYTTDYFTNYAVDWIEEYKNEDRPIFLYISYTAPHDPLMAWPEDIEKYEGMYDEGYESIRQKRYQKQLEIGLIDSTYKLSDPVFTPWDELSDSLRRFESKKMEVYAAMIDRMDQNIGRVLKKLRETGRAENSLILFASDNGASAEVVRLGTDDDTATIGSLARWVSLGGDWANVSNTPFRFYKNYSHEGGINTPLIVYWKDKIQEGTFSDLPGHFIDFMATFVDLTGADYPDEFNGEPVLPMQGRSFLPELLGEETEPRKEPLFWAWSDGKAMEQNNWKIVKEGESADWELYNMETDPTETNNLANQYPELVDKMDSIYGNWYEKYY